MELSSKWLCVIVVLIILIVHYYHKNDERLDMPQPNNNSATSTTTPNPVLIPTIKPSYVFSAWPPKWFEAAYKKLPTQVPGW